MKRLTTNWLPVLVVAAFAAGILAGYAAPAAEAQENSGTCFDECTLDSDCGHECSVDTAQGLKWMTCGQFGRCRREPTPCQPDWRPVNHEFMRDWQLTVDRFPWDVKCVVGADFWVTYRDFNCNEGERAQCESHTFYDTDGACRFERGQACSL